MIDDQTTEMQAGSLEIDLQSHGICWVLPAGGEISVGLLKLPGGALIQGKFSGRIVCKSGSLIVAETSTFEGQAEADRIYVDGLVQAESEGQLSSLMGRQLVAISDRARGEADLISQAFAIHTQTFSARFSTLNRP